MRAYPHGLFLKRACVPQITKFVSDYVLDDDGCLWLARGVEPILTVSRTKYGMYAASPESPTRAGTVRSLRLRAQGGARNGRRRRARRSVPRGRDDCDSWDG